MISIDLRIGPMVDDIVGLIRERRDVERAGLGVEGELVQVHLAGGPDCQALRVRDAPGRTHADKLYEIVHD